MSLTEFWKNFYIKYIGYGEYQGKLTQGYKNTWGIFSKYHIIMSLIMIAYIIWFTYRTRNYTTKQLNKSQKKIAIVMLLLETMRTIMFQIYHIDAEADGHTFLLRFDYCNQVCFFMPILVLIGTKSFYPFLAAVSFWGGMGVLLCPVNVWYGYGGWHILPIQSMISHGLMVLSSLNLARMFKVNLKGDFIKSAIGFGVMASLAAFFGFTRGKNYMGVLDPQGLPGINHLPAPWHFFALILIIETGLFIYLYTFSYLDKWILCSDIKEKREEFVTNEVQESNTTL